MKLFPSSNEAWINGQLKGAATACPYKGSGLWEVDPLSKEKNQALYWMGYPRNTYSKLAGMFPLS